MKTKVHRFSKAKQTGKVFFSKSEDSSFFSAQPKLNVGEPDDSYEREADKIADMVVRSNGKEVSNRMQNSLSVDSGNLQKQSISENITPLIQQKEEPEGNLQMQEEEEDVLQLQPEEEEEELIQAQAEVEEEEEMIQPQPEEEEEEMLQAQTEKEEEEPIQMQAEGMQMQDEEEEEALQAKGRGKAKVTPILENKLHSTKNMGSKMDPTTQQEMEQSFGADFGGVNIHNDSDAEKMTQQVGAQAFTLGRDIYFNKGKYNPGSNDGKHLLAHELTHTIQQTGRIAPQLQFAIGDNHDLQSSRFSGDPVLEACLDSEQTLRFGSRGSAVRKMQQALVDAGFPLPLYGVDGIFEEETQGALQNFQRSSGLAATGVLNSSTVSSLDALFTYGDPEMPGEISDTPPSITSDTINFAPNNTDTTRTDVGVGERVRFYGDTSGDWTASEGRIIGIRNGENMVWEAPAVATTSTITLTTPAGSASINMRVIAPQDLTMNVIRNESIPFGTAGACMINRVVVHPLNVSFGRTQWFEVPGPATNITGYYNRFPTSDLKHKPNPNYLPFNDDNSGLTDHAATHREPAPYAQGTFEWVIPNRYKIDGESDAQGRFFTNTTQSFYIYSNGTVLVTKAGTFVMRFVNNTVINGL